jgi:hypothetical protein
VTQPRTLTSRGAGGLDPADFDTVEELVRAQLLQAIGGWRGALEAALPIVAFLGVWFWLTGPSGERPPRVAVPVLGETDPLRASLLAAGMVLAALVAVRLAQRQTLQHVLSGVVGLAIAAVIALRTGNASDAFLPGILYNAVLGTVFVGSIVARWPVLGIAYGAITQDLSGWRSRPEVLLLFQRLTAVFAASYVLRVVVQLPLYLADSVVVLGVAKLVMGWPLVALSVVIIGALLARGRTPIVAPSRADGARRAPATDEPDRPSQRPVRSDPPG